MVRTGKVIRNAIEQSELRLARGKFRIPEGISGKDWFELYFKRAAIDFRDGGNPPPLLTKRSVFHVVEQTGFEPVISTMPLWRDPSFATAPLNWFKVLSLNYIGAEGGS